MDEELKNLKLYGWDDGKIYFSGADQKEHCVNDDLELLKKIVDNCERFYNRSDYFNRKTQEKMEAGEYYYREINGEPYSPNGRFKAHPMIGPYWDGEPVLMLGVRYEHYKDQQFSEKREWNYFHPQTAGHACNHHAYIGTLLKWKDGKVKTSVETIAGYWLESDAWNATNTLDTINKYRRQIRLLLGVDCNYDFREFEEAHYPVDCTIENIRKLSSDDIPEDFDKAFLQFENEAMRLAGFFGRWHLIIIGENCD